MIVSAVLPKGLTMGPATAADIERVYKLSHVYELAHYGEEDYSLDEIQTIWTGPAANLAEDSRLVFDQAGRLVGNLLLEQRMHAKFYAAIRILPDYSDASLGDHLLELAEMRARERMARPEPAGRATLNGLLPGR